MAEQVNIELLHDYDTGEAVAPITVVDAISGEGVKGQVVGFVEDNKIGVIDVSSGEEIVIDPTPTESSQNAVQSGGVWSELQKKPNPNLLINSNFLNPVNRNGKTEFTTAGMSIDKWRISTDSTIQVNVLDTGIRFVNSGTGNLFFNQTFDKNIPTEQIFTLSVLFSDGRLFYGSMTSGHYQVPLSGLYLCLNSNNVIIGTLRGNDFTIAAAKLELGSQQTLAHQENGVWVLNEIPSYAEEYAKCIQYSPITGAFVGSMYSNPNLLDNWYFADKRLVVNQRNQNIYNITTQAYTIDRWYGTQSGSSISVIDDGLLLTASESNYCVIMSKLVNLGLGGKTVTMSVLLENNELVYQTLDIPVDVHYDSPNMKFNGNSLSSADLIVEPDANSTVIFRVFAPPGTTLKIKAVKLEFGPVQTLAHKEGDTWVLNEIPDYATELAKCQRYQINLVSASNPEYGIVGVCRLRANNSGSFFVPLPVPLRAMPAVTWKGGFVVNGKTVSSISTDRMTENSVNLMAKTSTTDLVIGDIGELWYMSGDNMLLLDANL